MKINGYLGVLFGIMAGVLGAAQEWFFALGLTVVGGLIVSGLAFGEREVKGIE